MQISIVKIEKVRKELQLEHDEEALRVAKTIPIERIKNMSDFSVIAEAYFQNGEYETAMSEFDPLLAFFLIDLTDSEKYTDKHHQVQDE